MFRTTAVAFYNIDKSLHSLPRDPIYLPPPLHYLWLVLKMLNPSCKKVKVYFSQTSTFVPTELTLGSISAALSGSFPETAAGNRA